MSIPSNPPIHFPPPTANEFEYLAARRAESARAIRATLEVLRDVAVAEADPRLWARRYPWPTAVAAFTVGVTAATAIVPRRDQTPHTADHGTRPTSPQEFPPGTGNGAATAETTSNAHAGESPLLAGAKSLAWGAAYGLGRMALTQFLNGFMVPEPQRTDTGAEPTSDEFAHSEDWYSNGAPA